MKKKEVEKEEKIKYYTLENILKYNAHYNVIYGERSNGKTFSVLDYALKRYIGTGGNEQLGIIRRYDEDFKGKQGKQLYDSFINLGLIEKYTLGRYNSVYYYSQQWFLCKYDKDGSKVEQDNKPFALGFSLSREEHYKSSSFPNITTILFDEFITRNYYLPDEFIMFQSILSTIIRLRTNVKIFMCGNTINKYCPHFAEMGLTGVKTQKQGTIDLYSYGETDLKVAVEYSDMPSKKKPSNVYFAFNNPKLQMITNGNWEIDIYPHLPVKYKPKEVRYKFYIIFDRDILQGNVIYANRQLFIYIHRKTTPIREDNKQLIYQIEPNYKWNYRHSLYTRYSEIEQLICDLVMKQKVFYQDNEIGEIVNNFIKETK